MFKIGKTEHQGAKIEKAVGSIIKGLKKGIFNGFDYPVIYINVVTSASAAIDEATFLGKVDSLLGQGHIPELTEIISATWTGELQSAYGGRHSTNS